MAGVRPCTSTDAGDAWMTPHACPSRDAAADFRWHTPCPMCCRDVGQGAEERTAPSERRRGMKRTLAWVLSLALVASGVVAMADDGEHEGHHHHDDSKTRSDFALLNEPGGGVSVQCGAIRGGDE